MCYNMYRKKEINMNDNVIIYGGAFNPPTIAHLEIGKFIRKKFPSKRLVYLPTNDYYNKDLLAPFENRIEMLNLLIKHLDENVSISDYEFNNDSYKGTYYTLKHFNHPYFVIGADSLKTLSTWINGKLLIKENRFIVFPRDGFDVNDIIESDENLKSNKDNFIIISDNEFEKSDISSSEYRYNKNKNVLLEEIIEYIKEKGLYR